MSHQDNSNSDELSVTRSPLHEAAAQGQDGGVSPPPAPSGGSSAGAPPSNTAPANYSSGTEEAPQVLLFGVDSLYLSYRGVLSSEWEQRLEGLKLAAQGREDTAQPTAQARIGDHLFEVKDRGRGKFAYVLIDNHYHISLASARAMALPMAHVQISSELLTAIGVLEAERALRFIVNTLGQVEEEPIVSRADLFIDFTTSEQVAAFNADAWITRALRIDRHHVGHQFTGWSIGLGGDMAARLYDKTKEIEKSRKDYLKPLWASQGWDGMQTVWRLEFQFRRDVLVEFTVNDIDELLANLDGLWRYATTQWLRLTLPDPNDTNQTRWLTFPLWENLAALDWKKPTGRILWRVRKERVPSDTTLFINGLGGLTSFMAKYGITDLGEGFGEFMAQADRFHAFRGAQSGRGLNEYVGTKVSQKGRRYNTLDNRSAADLESESKEKEEAYRRAKDGSDK